MSLLYFFYWICSYAAFFLAHSPKLKPETKFPQSSLLNFLWCLESEGATNLD